MDEINPDDSIHNNDNRNRIHGSISDSPTNLDNGQMEPNDTSDRSEGNSRSDDG